MSPALSIVVLFCSFIEFIDYFRQQD